MTLFLAAFAWYMAGVGALMVLSPARAKRMTDLWMKDKINRAFVVLPAGIGALLVWAAPASRAPIFIQVLGGITLLKAAYLLVAPKRQLKEIVDWWNGLSQGRYRLWGLLTLALGIGIITTL